MPILPKKQSCSLLILPLKMKIIGQFSLNCCFFSLISLITMAIQNSQSKMLTLAGNSTIKLTHKKYAHKKITFAQIFGTSYFFIEYFWMALFFCINFDGWVDLRNLSIHHGIVSFLQTKPTKMAKLY